MAIDERRDRIAVFNLHACRSGEERVKVPLEPWGNLCRHAKAKRVCDTKNEEEANEREEGKRGGRKGVGEGRTKGIGAVLEQNCGWIFRMLVAFFFLLLKSGDVEVNPGPGFGECVSYTELCMWSTMTMRVCAIVHWYSN